MMKLTFACIFTLGLLTSASARAADVPSKAVNAPVKYKAVNVEFWNSFGEYVEEKKDDKAMDLVLERLARTKKDTLEHAEAELALGKLYKNFGFTWAATVVDLSLIQTRIGTFVATEALADLSEIAKKNPTDMRTIYNEVLFELETEPLTGDVADFVNYYQAKYNKGKGAAAWTDQNERSIAPLSYWGFQLKYDQLMEATRNEPVQKSVENFTRFMADPLTPPRIKNQAVHSYAKLIFESGNYDQAYDSFKTVEMDLRDRGFILLERAWAKYYLKDYSKALGLLTALEAPVFDATRSPEAYLLKMLIFKELCYFKSAVDVQKAFNERFGDSLALIRKRGDLTKNTVLIRLSAIDQEMNSLLTFYNLLKDEKKSLSTSKMHQFDESFAMNYNYELKLQEIASRIDSRMRDVVRGTADSLLDWQDQMSFLEYQTRLESLRIFTKDVDNDGKIEEIPLGTFANIYWKFTGEYWLDELESIKVNIPSKCGQGSSK
jgi:hypothetical protein